MKHSRSKTFKISMLVIAFIAIILLRIYLFIDNSDQSPQLTNTFIPVTDSSRYIDNIFDSLDNEVDILYSEAINSEGEKEKLYLDLYKPSEDKETNRPAIIWIHGGGFTSGTKDTGMEKDFAIDFAKKGYVTLNINYRLAQNTVDYNVVQRAVDDAAAALKWLIENSDQYGVDKNRIAIGGMSAGGGTAINLCYSDLTAYGIDKKSILAAIDLAGGSLYSGSVNKGDPPCIMIHGTRDNKVPFTTSENLSNALTKKKIYNVLYPLEGSDHDIRPYYDTITNEITKFLYKVLTGKEVNQPINEGKSYEYDKVEKRLASAKTYNVKQIDIKVDGKLDEWGNSEVMVLDQLKDAGNALPSKEDYSATAMVGWNQQDPTRLYMAFTITDDIIQDINSAERNWFNDDCLEIAFDLSKDEIASPTVKGVIGATGNDLSLLFNKDNLEYKIINDGNLYTYEMAIDLTNASIGLPDVFKNFKAKAGDTIGFSPSYNEAEDNIRQQQIGWIAGKANDRINFGNLNFIIEKAN